VPATNKPIIAPSAGESARHSVGIGMGQASLNPLLNANGANCTVAAMAQQRRCSAGRRVHELMPIFPTGSRP